MGRSSQRKGREAEIELANLLQEQGFHVRPGAPVSYGSTPDLVGLNGIHIECKRVEKLNVLEALQQATRDSQRFGGLPALFHRRNHNGWMVTMWVEDWLKLYSAWEGETDE